MHLTLYSARYTVWYLYNLFIHWATGRSVEAQDYKSFSRLAVALGLVVAIAMLLWFSAPVAETSIAASNEGLLYTNTGEYHKAIAAFTRAIELDPNFTDAYISRGWVYIELEQYEQAVVDYTKAIELDPSLADAYINRSGAYIELGQYEQAIVDYEKAVQLNANL